MQVIATAGHVDHGKSTLLRALTGMEPDRWVEERRRGLTIDLGFVWTDELAFVDVPGHERFVTNMLAGVGATPAVLFAVAADGGWRPQSQEHLEIITALGVRHGLLAVTRSDLADPAPVLAEAAQRLKDAGLDVPAVAVSATSGQGMDALKAELAALARRLPASDPEADVRFWIDRAFTVRGRGTVITGTLQAGTVRVGDRLATPDGQTVDVRGVQSRGADQKAVSGPARVALNVKARVPLRRGHALLTPGRWLPTEVVDVRVDGSLVREMTWHLGSCAVQARVRPLGDTAVRITLAEPLPLRIGDRALLRDPGSRRATGVTVLDVRPPELGRRGAAARRAEALTGYGDVPDGAAEVARRGVVRRDDLLAMGAAPPFAPTAGDWLLDPAHAAALSARLTEAVGPQGLPLETARRLLGLPDRSLVEVVAEGAGLRQARGRLVPASRQLPPDLEKALGRLHTRMEQAPFDAPTAEQLAGLGFTPASLATAETAGRVLRLPGGVVLLPGAEALAVETLASLPQPFTTSQAREALGTSRRVAIPLLEHLDRLGSTVRAADHTRKIVA
ncbi:SelB C-terminal domain-containing protein [Rhizohabitans arisaemae]|uniref:SelB domain-containing protein n=1 Tax=Rhizohabitans arisaemae TaxID=2720610 RepID=UPI0024B1402A|nr:SelB C-terminal domain-containing protein [Rhizohabitans arisaemae]